MKALAATMDSTLVEFADLPEPTPAADEVLVRVEAFSVNRGEIFALTGVYGPPAARGRVMGQDIVGRVVTTAADGSGPAVGARVVAHPEGGGWAELVAVPTSKVAIVPDAVTAVAVAALPLAGLTALRLLRKVGELPGSRILLTGASGGVGHYLVELAAAAGAVVTAVSSSHERGQRLTELGAATVVRDVAEADEGYDVVLESVGGKVFSEALARLRPGGKVLWFGQASLDPITLDFFQLFSATPFTLEHFPHWVSDTTDGADLRELVELIAADTLHPEIGRVADWADTRTTLTDLNNRRIRGNAVLTIEER